MIMRLEPSSRHRGIRPGIPSYPLHLLAVPPYRPPYSVHGLHRLLLPRRLDQRYDNHREGFRQLLHIAAQNRHFEHREARELDLAEAFPFVVVGVDPVGPVVDGGEEFRGCVADCDGGVCEAEAVARGVCFGGGFEGRGEMLQARSDCGVSSFGGVSWVGVTCDFVFGRFGGWWGVDVGHWRSFFDVAVGALHFVCFADGSQRNGAQSAGSVIRELDVATSGTAGHCGYISLSDLECTFVWSGCLALLDCLCVNPRYFCGANRADVLPHPVPISFVDRVAYLGN